MKIIVIADEEQKTEWMVQGVAGDHEITWMDQLPEPGTADVIIDLLFEKSNRPSLKKFLPAIVVVNDMMNESAAISSEFIRLNGWPGFLKRPVVECSSGNDSNRKKAEELFQIFGKKTEWVTNIPGFVSARVISMIINEAYFAIEDEVSTREEIDTAMKLGTNYPFGPFEWSRLIGIKNIFELLETLSVSNGRYSPASVLKQEALNR